MQRLTLQEEHGAVLVCVPFELLNEDLQWALGDVVHDWAAKNLGDRHAGDWDEYINSAERATHAARADKVFLLASSLSEANLIINELLQAFCEKLQLR